MNGGVGYQNAGSGKFLYKKTGENGTLVVTGSSSDGAYTPQAVSSLTVDDLRLANSAIYTVTSSEALILSAASPFSSGDGTGKLIIESGGTFTPTSTVNFTIANATLQLSRNATFTSSSTLDIIIGNSGTFDLRNYTVSAPLTLDTLTIQSGGTMTHGANTTAQTHVVFVSATTVDIQSGGTVNVTGKGYTGGAALAAGNGPGAGVYATAEAGSGAGHGGAGSVSFGLGKHSGPMAVLVERGEIFILGQLQILLYLISLVENLILKQKMEKGVINLTKQVKVEMILNY